MKSTSPLNWSSDFAHSVNHPRQGEITRTNHPTKHSKSSTSDSCSEELPRQEISLNENEKPLPITKEETHYDITGRDLIRTPQMFQNSLSIYETQIETSHIDNSDCTTSQPADQLTNSIKTIDVSLPNANSSKAALEETTLDAYTTVEVEKQKTT